MATAVKTKSSPQINVRPTPEDQKIFAALRRKLGVDNSQIVRMGIRLLATKEGVTA